LTAYPIFGKRLDVYHQARIVWESASVMMYFFCKKFLFY